VLQFVTGSRLDLNLDFRDLTPDTTIHAISTKLVQETCTPVRAIDTESSPTHTSPVTDSSDRSTSLLRSLNPNNRSERRRGPVRSTLSTLWASIIEKPPILKSAILDEYLIFTEGADHAVTPNGFQLRYGHRLWRGEAGRAVDSAQHQREAVSEANRDEEVYLDDIKAGLTSQGGMERTERTNSTMRLNRRLRLPSEVQGMGPSSITLSPVLARVSHRIEVDVIYSILGREQDQPDKPRGSKLLHGDDGDAEEGAMHLAKAMVQINLAACTVTPSVIQPPAYLKPTTPPNQIPITFSHSQLQRHHSRISRRTSIGTVDTHRPTLNDFLSRSRSTFPLPMNAAIPHSRAFLASNSRIVARKSVFYNEGEVEDAVARHCLDKGECACRLMREGLWRVISGSG